MPSLSFNEPDPNEDPYNMLFYCLLCLYFGKKKNVQEVHIARINCFLLLILT